MRGETICTVAPCSLSQRWAPRISTSSTPLVQQIAIFLPFKRFGFDGGSNRKALSSRLSSPSAVTRSSVEIDGTGEVDINCCMRLTWPDWGSSLIFRAPLRRLFEGFSTAAAVQHRDQAGQRTGDHRDGPGEAVHVPGFRGELHLAHRRVGIGRGQEEDAVEIGGED